MVSVTSLTKYYNNIKAVDKVSFEVKATEVVGFLGPNGAGKTTTMQILTGYINPTSGNVSIDGIDILSEPVTVKEKIGYLPENNPLYDDLTVFEFLDFVASIRKVNNKKKTIMESAEKCGIIEVINRKIGNLSKGYRQRVGIAQAILHSPKILILDEPTTGLDPLQIQQIRHLIKELGKEKTIILSTHILSEVEQTCARVIVINKGKIVADSSIDNLKGELAGSTVILQYRGDITPDVFKVFGKLQIVQENGKDYIIKITPDQKKDIREQIYRFCCQKGILLLELYKEKKSLESIFRELTKDDKKNIITS